MPKKGTHGYQEDNYTSSFDDYKTDMTNIDDEVDRILAEQRKAKQQIDFFSDDPIKNDENDYVFDNDSSRELKSNSPRRNTYSDDIDTEEETGFDSQSENYGDSTEKSSRKSSGRGSSSKDSSDKKKKSKKNDKGHSSNKSKKDNRKTKEKKAEKSSKRSDRNTDHSEKKKHTGLKAFIIIVIILGAFCGGVYLYFGHIPTKADIENLLPVSDSEQPTSSTSIHETLVVVTVSGDTVTYNGEVLNNVDELNSKLASEKDLTLSLINNDANALTYNKVAEIMNQYGGNFELMDENNTNPSINTEEYTTEPSTVENTTESVAESTTEPVSESTSLAE